MSTQYYCKNERRRALVRNPTDAQGNPVAPFLNGIDYLEVSSDQRTLTVFFIHNLPGQPGGVPSNPALALTAGNVVIEGGVRIRNVRVTPPASASGNALSVSVDQPGDFSAYTLRLVSLSSGRAAPEGFDPQLSEVEFSFKVDCPSDFDCKPADVCPPEPLQPGPPIDYLARDYASFRQLMLDRLATTLPDWKERNPADVGVAIVELAAYYADYLSYYQDAVATEAYLGTARRRISVRRHARLLDYFMHEGCNARAWVQIQVEADDIHLEKGSRFLTRVPGLSVRIAPDSPELEQTPARQAQAFETMHPVHLYTAHNRIRFYTWSDEECCLPRGATRATLRDDPNNRLRLLPGDVLVFEEVRGPTTGEEDDADPGHRHAVRLTRVEPLATTSTGGQRLPGPLATDPLTGQPIVEIEWHVQDALPFPLCISTVVNRQAVEDVSVARGNIVLADHGETISGRPLPSAPETGAYTPRLEEKGVTHAVAYDNVAALLRPAAEALVQDPRAALPQVALHEDGEDWTARRDLLSSSRFARDFVLEVESDGAAFLRFGDNVLGRRPDPAVALRPEYRVGNGVAGNVGAEAIAHLVTTDTGIIGVRNPLPAQGGAASESIEEVRLYAPQAFRTQQRAITEADYAEVAQRHPEVQKAVASRRWTGSWHTMFITVDRRRGMPVDEEFEAELRSFLERYRLAGHDVEVEPPSFAPLDIALRVCVAPDYYRSSVKEALLETFSNRDLPDGRRGFFHPDNYTFGQPVYLSQVVAAAMKIPGVLWVDVVVFQRWGRIPEKEIEEGQIRMERLEIAQLDNDPNAPENGRIAFEMEGGI